MTGAVGGSPGAGDQEFYGHELLARARAALSSDPALAIELANSLLEYTASDALIAQANLCIGLAEQKIGNLERAVAALVAAREHFRTSGQERGAVETLIALGQAYRNSGQFQLASDNLEQALAIAVHQHDSQAQADALNGLAGIHHARGESQQALERLNQALEIRRQMGDFERQAHCLSNIGILYTDQGDYPRALEALLEARTLLQRELSNPRAEGNCLINIGRVYEHTGDYTEAARVYSEALQIGTEAKDQLVEIVASVNLGTVRRELGELETAAALFKRGLEHSRAIRFRVVEIAALDGLASVELRFGRYGAAITATTEALGIAREIGDREREIEALMNLARAHLGLGAPQEALGLLESALGLAQEAELMKLRVDITELLSQTFEELGDPTRALGLHREFHRLERALVSAEAERRTRNLKLHFELERARTENELYRIRAEAFIEANAQLEEKVSERTRELEDTRVEVVMRLAVAAEYRDDNTGQHTKRVGDLAAEIAQHMGMPPEEVALLRLAARLHDVGKIGISDLIMLKPDRLTPEEFERIKEHTVIGAQILSGGRSPLLQMAEVVALSHHERWDGGGYPKGLSGEDIPLVGRIVSVADVYDALMAHRPYKKPWSESDARAEIVKQSERQFDPRVVQTFLSVIANRVLPEDEDLVSAG